MHSFPLTTSGGTVVHSRASRRARRRRAVIALVFGLLAGGGGSAFADPSQYQLEHPRTTVHGPNGWHQWQAPKHAHLPGSHAATGGRTVPDPENGSALDWQILAVIAMSGAPAVVLLRRRRRLHAVA